MDQLEARDAASDAAVLEDAIEVLRLRFGVLTAGDLISGLTGAAASIRAQGGIIRAAEQSERGDAIRLRLAVLGFANGTRFTVSDWERLLDMVGGE